MNSDYLIVYGTLQRDSDNVMSQFLAQHSDAVAKGYFQGQLFKISWFPGAVLSSNPDDKVYGSIFKLKDVKSVLKVLDDYEGYDASNLESSLFKREITECFLDNGTSINAWVYLYNQNTEDKPRIISGDFLKDGST